MKRLCAKLTLFLLFIFSTFHELHAEGFLAGTLVKVPHGYTRIENLHVGDYVVCLDDEKNLAEGVITYVGKKPISQYVYVKFGDERVGVACDQLFWNTENNVWIEALCLQSSDVLMRYEAVDVYFIEVAQYHNFFVTKSDICVHNFVPPLVVALSVAFGSGSIELAGISCGFAGLGAFLGYKWHKKDKEKHKFVMEPQFYQNGIHFADDAQAPGMPTEKDGFYPPKKWDGKKVRSPKGPGYGWPDKNGNIWVPTGPKGHGGPHWDVQMPRGKTYRNVLPGGKDR